MRSAILAVLMCAVSGICPAQAGLHVWDVFELDMRAQTATENPYVDALPTGGAGAVDVVFTGTSGDAEGKTVKIHGFWDGGPNWKARFAPPAAGEWSYASVSEDTGLNGVQGTITCIEWTETELAENAVRRGFVRVCTTGDRAGRHFEYADGTPFLWIGDTWWNWAKRDITFQSFKKLADDRAAKGFTVGQLFFAGRGWGRNASMLDRTFDRPDIEHIRHVENYIRYANSIGLTVWVHGWWSSQNMDRTVGAEKMRRWWRYMVHRLGAYNVMWVLAGEYNMHNYGGMGLQFWKDLGAMVEAEDPYDRIIGAHPTPPAWDGGDGAPQWSTAEVLHGESWLDYNQSQVGHGRWRNDMIPLVVADAYHRKPAKPIVVTEPWYEFIEGSAAAEDIRFGAWSAVLSGAAGHSYAGGHVWKAHVPESRAGSDTWPMDLSFEVNTLDYPGAVSLGFMAKFLQGIEWWTLRPHPELVVENPSRFCAAEPGREYVVYLRYGGAVKIDLTASEATAAFKCTWYDLTESKAKKTEAVKGGGAPRLHPPTDYPARLEYKDWLVHVVRQ